MLLALASPSSVPALCVPTAGILPPQLGFAITKGSEEPQDCLGKLFASFLATLSPSDCKHKGYCFQTTA